MQRFLSHAARIGSRKVGAFLALCLLLSGLGLLTRAAADVPPAQEWITLYPNPIGDYPIAAYDMALDREGNIVATGFMGGTDSALSDYVTIKYDGVSGQPRWVTRYLGLGKGWDYAVALALDTAGNVYVTGYSAGVYVTGSSAGSVYHNSATIKYDGATGQQLWIAIYDGAETYAVAVDAVGNVYVTGDSGATLSESDYVTVKYDGTTGQRLWVSQYNGPGNDADLASAQALDSAGDIYVTGKSTGIGGSANYTTIKYDGATGQQLWIASESDSGGGGVVVDAAGNVYVTGHGNVKYDGATGRKLWVARGASGSGIVNVGPRLDSAGNMFVAGYFYQGNDPISTTAKYDGATGQRLWVANYGRGRANALAVDEVGNVYVTGISYDPPAGGEGYGYGGYGTVKYDGSTGMELWSRRYSPSGSRGDNAHAVAVDRNGNVYVTGGTDNSWGFATIKYRQNAPVLTDVLVTFRSQTGANILWNTSEPATSRVEYGTTPAYGVTVAQGAYVSFHNVPLTGLTPGTRYYYRVSSSLVDGTELSPVTGSFTTVGNPPTIIWGTPSPAPNAAGWNNTSVVYPFTVRPADAGTVDTVSPLHYITEGFQQTQRITITVADGTRYTFASPALNLDFTAPQTTASLAGPLGNNGWYTGPVTVTLAAADALSGVAQTFYTVDGGAPQPYTAPFTVSGDAVHSVTCWSGDRAGNTETAQSLTVRIDGTPPAVQWGTPTPSSNASGWYSAAVDVPFTVSDALSGVATVNPPGPLHLTAEGWNVTGTVTVTDAAGNTTAVTSAPVRIDRTAAHTTASVVGPGGQNGWYVRPVTVHLEGTDALSGVAATYYQLDGGAAKPFTGNLALTALGTHQLQYWSVDRAGNTEATQSLTLRLEAAGPVVTIQAVPTRPDAPNGGAARVNVSGSVSNTQAGLVSGQTRYAVTDRAGKTVASGPVTLDKRGQYHFALRLLGPDKGGAPLPYVITVQAQDLAGARGAASAVVNVR